VRQLLTASAVRDLLGAIAGILLAFWCVHALTPCLPSGLAHFGAVRVDGWVLGFALALSLVSSLGFGLAPALRSGDAHLEANLREGAARSGEGGRRSRVRNFLAASELALALVVVVAVGLLIRSSLF